MHVFWTDLEIISRDVLLKLNRSLAQLRVRLINCWMSALKAKVSAMAAAALLPGFTISLSLRFLVELSHNFLEDFVLHKVDISVSKLSCTAFQNQTFTPAEVRASAINGCMHGSCVWTTQAGLIWEQQHCKVQTKNILLHTGINDQKWLLS